MEEYTGLLRSDAADAAFTAQPPSAVQPTLERFDLEDADEPNNTEKLTLSRVADTVPASVFLVCLTCAYLPSLMLTLSRLL